MNKLIAVVGASGVGKTALVQALSSVYPFATAYEQHAERPFQALFKNDSHYALANQIDYFLLRAEQEKLLRRASARIGLIDGGLDLDFHGFTRLTSTRLRQSARAFTAAACSLTPSSICAGAFTASSASYSRGLNSSSACTRMK